MKEQIDGLIKSTQLRIEELQKMKGQALADHHATGGAIVELTAVIEKLKGFK